MSPPACRAPLGLRVLLEYWLGELPAEEQDRIEEHLLDCGACSDEARDLVAVAAGVHRLVTSGRVRVVVTGTFLGRLAADGLRVREYRVAPSGTVRCTVAPGDDVLATRLVADLHGVERLDVVGCDAEGRERGRLTDVPVRASAGEVVLLEAIDRIRAMPAGVERVQLVASGPAGERVLGEYTFVHTPWPG
ncbi:MAG TPA: zf-HC2 domain-containing protein [Calidithermus sp.]|nr:zf-HC2 domain-containing protein [Calidithermus sp.]